MDNNASLVSTLLITAAALLCAGLQLAGIDALAGSHRAPAGTQGVVQSPPALVAGERASATTAVQHLPQVVIVGQRSDAAPTVTARTGPSRPAL